MIINQKYKKHPKTLFENVFENDEANIICADCTFPMRSYVR